MYLYKYALPSVNITNFTHHQFRTSLQNLLKQGANLFRITKFKHNLFGEVPQNVSQKDLKAIAHLFY